MKTDYCAYPPQIAADVEVAEQRDGGRAAFIAGSASAGRFIILRETERKVFNLIDESRAPRGVCEEFKARHGGNLALPTLVKFLTRLDQVGILAGNRSQGRESAEQQASQAIYVRFKLFNPERLFERMVPALRWVWTAGFVVATGLLMLATLLLSLMHWAEVASYARYALSEHFVAIFIAGWVVVVSHEFAHGLTCKAFGGRVNEVGVLLIFYFLPGLYCNVSGIHLIPRRNRRLWVIAAGIYWQLLVGAFALLSWFALAPHTLLADLAFIFFLGSVLNIVINANPLIKLDGYYFLSQLLRLPNLMDRSRAFWRSLLKRILFGERGGETAAWDGRERAIYAAFGLLSFLYTVGLATFIVVYIGQYLVDRFYLFGLILTAGIALFYARRPIKHLASKLRELATSNSGGGMASNDQAKTNAGEAENQKSASDQATKPSWLRRRITPLAVALLAVAVLLMPWRASVGNYGALVALPNQEAIIRAPENATLIALRAQPGERVSRGAAIGRMGNLELEEQIAQAQSELARVNADYDRLLGELRAREESAVRAELQLGQRRREFDEIEAERRQIADAHAVGNDGGAFKVVRTSLGSNDSSATRYPAALSAMQSDVDLRRARLNEADTQLSRARRLYADGIAARGELDAAETRARTLALELAGARDRLEAALIEHRRKHASATTEMNLARSDAGAEKLRIEKLGGELRAIREIIATLEARRDLLLRKQSQFELIAPTAGAVFGEDLPRMVGQYFQKGAEICRVADTSQLLLRIQVPEREIGDVRAGRAVRLKTRTFPNQVFRGVVSKIGGESEQDQYGQATYRVELTIENSDGLLRPGMTAFARIDFDRRMVGSILLHKVKQALRPELWML